MVDDYGHHPTEIAAVIDAARAAAPVRVVVAFQPHRYSRTAQLMPEFAAALAAADEVVLTDIYPAGEEPIPGVDVEALAAAVNRRRARPVSVVRAARPRRPGGGGAGRARRPGDHARGRVDRRRRRPGGARARSVVHGREAAS